MSFFHCSSIVWGQVQQFDWLLATPILNYHNRTAQSGNASCTMKKLDSDKTLKRSLRFFLHFNYCN